MKSSYGTDKIFNVYGKSFQYIFVSIWRSKKFDSSKLKMKVKNNLEYSNQEKTKIQVRIKQNGLVLFNFWSKHFDS